MDLSKSLQELEGVDEGEPQDAPTNMVRRCIELYRTPLEQYSADDCRLMLGQRFNPRYLVPLALEFLSQNPLESGMMYPGALLNSVLGVSGNFWVDNSQLRAQINDIIYELESLRRAVEYLAPAIKQFQTLMAE